MDYQKGIWEKYLVTEDWSQSNQDYTLDRQFQI